jgi:alkylation response protein AidB-like acyl-CoA dehydrogenase
LKVGVVENKIGLRLNQNAEIVFDNWVVPGRNVLGSVNGGADIMRTVRSGSNAKEAARMLGTGHAALEAARRWARERVQGGVPLTEHQAIGNKLAEMAVQLEAARGLVWRAAWACDHDPDQADTLSTMAVVFTSKAVMDVAVASFELHGSHGVRRGSEAERHLRNAATMLHIPAGSDALLARLHRLMMATADSGRVRRRSSSRHAET